MLIPVIFLACGFLLLGAGAELMVTSSSRLAIKLGVTPLVVGLTIVAFGTSAPELAVSIQSTIQGSSALALGNVIGSNIANIGLILAITALIQPVRIEIGLIRKQIPIMIAVSLGLGLMLIDRELDYSDGLLLASGLIAYLVISYKQADSEFDYDDLAIHPERAAKDAGKTSLNLLYSLLGLGLLVFGSNIFVNNAVTLARLFDISEAVIGLTLVAIGTSVPELATSVIAAVRKESDIAVGNVIGSNMFNILAVLGISALVGTIQGDQFALLDFISMILFTAILLPFAWSGLTLSRTEGFFLLSGYLAYLLFVAQQANLS